MEAYTASLYPDLPRPKEGRLNGKELSLGKNCTFLFSQAELGSTISIQMFWKAGKLFRQLYLLPSFQMGFHPNQLKALLQPSVQKEKFSPLLKSYRGFLINMADGFIFIIVYF